MSDTLQPLMKRILQKFLPDRVMPLPILTGPFRGARLHMNLRGSLRKVCGVYEHELSGWIKAALPRVDKMLDVGAGEGYFSLGAEAAFRRLKKTGEVIAFEPDPIPLENLKAGINGHDIALHPLSVGAEVKEGMTTLDEIAKNVSPTNALIKIDVEGAELEVIAGASQWLNPTNYFLIEVHWDETFLTSLTETFRKRGLELVQINQRPLPIIGYEARARNQWWLVSSLH